MDAKEWLMRYVKAVLAGLLTSLVFAVCAFSVITFIEVSQVERETGGGIGAVSIGISDAQLLVPVVLGFALGFSWVWRRTRTGRS